MDVRTLSPELSKKAKNELFEKPERIEKDVEAIKEWLNKQPHINARMDDQWLLGFMRGSKHSLERTKEKIDLFYTMKTIAPDVSVCITTKDPMIQELLTAGVILPLLNTTQPDDPRVIIVRAGAFNSSKIPIAKLICLVHMFNQIQIRDDDQSVVAGQVYIVDLKGIGMSLLTQITPSLMKKVIVSRQEGLPIREKGVHHVNVPSAAAKIITVVKTFMKEKHRNRFHVHCDDVDTLNDFVSKSILPPEYGGDGDSINHLIEYWKKRIEDNEAYFQQDSQYKTNESKRPGKPKNSDVLFGIEGSFRKLDVD